MLKKCRIAIAGAPELWAYPGPLLLDLLNDAGHDLHNDCGGQGKCGKCRVVFHRAAPEPVKGDLRHLSAEQIAAGVRLACFHQLREECELEIPEPAPVEWLD